MCASNRPQHRHNHHLNYSNCHAGGVLTHVKLKSRFTHPFPTPPSPSLHLRLIWSPGQEGPRPLSQPFSFDAAQHLVFSKIRDETAPLNSTTLFSTTATYHSGALHEQQPTQPTFCPTDQLVHHGRDAFRAGRCLQSLRFFLRFQGFVVLNLASSNGTHYRRSGCGCQMNQPPSPACALCSSSVMAFAVKPS